MAERDRWIKSVAGINQAIGRYGTAGGYAIHRDALKFIRDAHQANADSLVDAIPPTNLVPYIDPTALDIPWPKHSHYKQPWKGWPVTTPATTLRDGLGLVFDYFRDNDPTFEIEQLAAQGIKRIRVEVPWSQIGLDGHLTASANTRVTQILQATKANGIRPLILLNSNHGVPCPYTDIPLASRTVDLAASKGARSVRVSSVAGIVPHLTGFSNLSDYKMAEVLVTAVNTTTRFLTLSQPLPVAFPVGPKEMHTLKYKPLRLVGTPDFEDTLTGWLEYVREVARVVESQGIQSYDLEIWNELTFGAHFLSANLYYNPGIQDESGNPLEPGVGRYYVFGKRTVDMLRAEFPKANPIWGFTNTTFFNPGVDRLPVGTGGASYHPYMFVDYEGPSDEQVPESNTNLEGYAPVYSAHFPEAVMAAIKTEFLERYTAPPMVTPPNTLNFQHMITEHGICPRDFGVDDVAAAMKMKAKSALRCAVTFLHRGLSALYLFSDVSGNPTCFDLVEANGTPTPALQALGRLASKVAGAQPATPKEVEVSINLTPNNIVFAGDATHPPLTEREILAVLPFQINTSKMGVAIYVMTRDITKPYVESMARVKLMGVSGPLSAYDPELGMNIPLSGIETTSNSVEFNLAVTDSPRWVEIG